MCLESNTWTEPHRICIFFESCIMSLEESNFKFWIWFEFIILKLKSNSFDIKSRTSLLAAVYHSFITIRNILKSPPLRLLYYASVPCYSITACHRCAPTFTSKDHNVITPLMNIKESAHSILPLSLLLSRHCFCVHRPWPCLYRVTAESIHH